MINELLKVGRFMKLMEQPVQSSPVREINKKEARLRIRLTDEENEEFRDCFLFKDDENYLVNRVEALDALLDRLYVLLGDAHALGLALVLPVGFDRVHESNMSKLWTEEEKKDAPHLHFTKKEGFGIRKYIARDDFGKTIKSPSYNPVDLHDLIEMFDEQEFFTFSAVRASFNESEEYEQLSEEELFEES